jgi:NADPH-dependent ferric siderophore reductase
MNNIVNQQRSQPNVQRIRHEARLRLLTVKRVTRVTPRMVRVTLTGDLQGFTSAAYDDHVKLFFPAPGSIEPILPKGPPGSPEAAQGPAPIARDYTPRGFDVAANELDIEFVLHSEGPATSWAEQAKPGDQLGVGGPRGSFVVNGEFDWHLLVADEAGLPAIARRLSELPANTKVFVVAEVADAHEEQPFATQADVHVTWLHRRGQPPGQGNALIDALAKEALPSSAGYTWIACESNVARKLRNFLITERGFDKHWIKAAGYWKHGVAATHEKHED